MKPSSKLQKLYSHWRGITACIMVATCVINTVFFIFNLLSMNAFMFEETLQRDSFSYAIPMMNKDWESAYGCLVQREKFMELSSTALTSLPDFKFWAGFRAYGRASKQDIAWYKDYLQMKIQQQKLDKFLASKGR